jgi:hypothetical protein
MEALQIGYSKEPKEYSHFLPVQNIDRSYLSATLPLSLTFNPMSVERPNFPGDGTILEERMSRDRSYPNYERQLETIKPVVEQIQNLYDATENMESSFRNSFRNLLSAMEVALRYEASFLQDPDQYAKWREVDPDKYPQRGELGSIARKYLDKAIENLNFGKSGEIK